MKKKTSLLMTLILLTALLVPAVSYGDTFNDIKGHWAESYINEAVQKGFVQGYPDGTFIPDKSVTRAEFTAMVNKALKNTATSSISFTDVPSNEWFYSDISKAVAATYVAGYDNNTFLPNSPITRQEAAVVISRIVPTYGSSGNLSAYGDSSSVADWAYTAFQKVNGKQYIGAYDDGNLHPLDKLTRAQTAKIICDILNKETIVTNDPVVRSNNTTLSNTIYSNGVTIHRDLADGNATLENCIVLGNLSVQGGGDNTVTVSNSRVAQSTVEKSDSSVRVLVKGESVVSTLTAAKTATIQTSNLSGGLYGSGIGSLSALSSSDIKLQGSFPKVSVNGSASKLTLVSGSITTLVVSANAKQSDITIDSGASVGTAEVNAESYFHGAGTISRMDVYANNVTYEKKPTTLNVGSQYTPPTEATPDLAIKFSPENGAIKVAVDTRITITFNTAMKLYDGGGTITSSNIADYISLRKNSFTGTKVDYSASINSAKTVITLEPDDDLEVDVKYFVVLDKNAFKDSDGEGNKAQTISFTTGTGTDSFTSYNPQSNATGVRINIEPTITFGEAVQTYAGKTVNSSYLDDSVIIFTENNINGTKVDFTATISNKRVITIVPDSDLKEGQVYCIGVVSKKFKTESKGATVTESSIKWTTTGGTSTNAQSAANNVSIGSNVDVTSTGGSNLSISGEMSGFTYTYALKPASIVISNSTGGATNVPNPGFGISTKTLTSSLSAADFAGANYGRYSAVITVTAKRSSDNTTAATATSDKTIIAYINKAKYDAAAPPAETDEQAVAVAREALSFDTSSVELSESTPSKTFTPTGTRSGITYTYSLSLDKSSGFNINNMTLSANDFSEGHNATLTITATISKGSVSDTKEFTINVTAVAQNPQTPGGEPSESGE